MDISLIIDKFWPALVAIGSGVLALFYKQISSGIVLLIRMLVVKWKKAFSLHLTCPVPGIQSALDEIRSQLKPNGGGSMRDAINKANCMIDNNNQMVESIDKKLTGLYSKIAAMQVSHDIISDTLNICRWASDEHGQINFINNPLRSLLGSVDDSSLLGDGWTNVVYKEDRAAAIAEWKRCVESKIEYHDTYRVKNIQTGKIMKITSHARVSRSMNNAHVDGWIGVVIPFEEDTVVIDLDEVND